MARAPRGALAPRVPLALRRPYQVTQLGGAKPSWASKGALYCAWLGAFWGGPNFFLKIPKGLGHPEQGPAKGVLRWAKFSGAQGLPLGQGPFGNPGGLGLFGASLFHPRPGFPHCGETFVARPPITLGVHRAGWVLARGGTLFLVPTFFLAPQIPHREADQRGVGPLGLCDPWGGNPPPGGGKGEAHSQGGKGAIPRGSPKRKILRGEPHRVTAKFPRRRSEHHIWGSPAGRGDPTIPKIWAPWGGKKTPLGVKYPPIED